MSEAATRWLFVGALSVASFLSLCPSAKAISLSGETIAPDWFYPTLDSTNGTCGCFDIQHPSGSSVSFTVGDGIETYYWNGSTRSLAFDFSAYQLTITKTVEPTTFFNEGVSFNGAVFTLASGNSFDPLSSVVTSTSAVLFSAANVSFAASNQQLLIDFAGVFLNVGDQIVLNFQTPAPVPLAPSIIVQFTGLALLGLLGWRRKRLTLWRRL